MPLWQVTAAELPPAYARLLGGHIWSWVKLRAWQLTAYSRVVYLDTDMMALLPFDALFAVAAAPVRFVYTSGRHSRLSDALFVATPDAALFEDMVAIVRSGNFT